ncbi:sortase domain-bontaining protein [Butyrivibrio sp. JL13D10]|uniref:sortase domain-containing protein n=1 Tax=Butyrivibrio sp. JL13D10 TaxID=3236815 RepID=UPI0038B6AF14
MSGFKKKLFTKMVLGAKSYNEKHKEHAKGVTFFTLGVITVLSLLLYIPEKIFAAIRKVFGFLRKKAVYIAGILVVAIVLVAGWRLVTNIRRQSSADQENGSVLADSTTDNSDAVSLDETKVTDQEENTSQAVEQEEETAQPTEPEEETVQSTAQEEETVQSTAQEEETVQAAEQEEETSQEHAQMPDDTKETPQEPESEVKTDEETKSEEKSAVVTKNEDGQAGQISEKVETSDSKSNKTDTAEDSQAAKAAEEKIKSFMEEHPEAVGWISMEDETISYPIMHTDNNEKYLSIDSDGNASETGAIFLDSRSAADFEDSNSIIYGHNMKDKTMFGNLRKYREDPSYYNDHQYFEIITPEGIYKYKIFAYMDVPDHYVIYDYVSDAAKAFVADAEAVRRKSYMDSEFPVNSDSKVITLSTCTAKDELRFVILGVRVEE